MAQFAFDFEKSLEPGKAIAEMTLKGFEQMVSFNTDLYNKYSAMALENTKEAMEVSDIESAQAYFTKQSEKAKTAFETMVADAKTAVEMGQGYSEEFKAVITDLGEKAAETVKAEAAAPKAAPAKKPAAKKAAAKA